MKKSRRLAFLFWGLCLFACSIPSLRAKPPSSPNKNPSPVPSPTASPTPAFDNTPGPLAHWLLIQNGGKDALELPLAEVIHAATGKNVLPFDPATPPDAAMLSKLGGVLDRILPGMNKPESSAHVVNRTDEVTAFFEDALRAFIPTIPGLSCPPVLDEAIVKRTAGSFPTLRVLDSSSGKSYYLGVTLYPAGGREVAERAMQFYPVEAAARMTEDGCCLLVGIEHNGKIGKEIAFLNWELIDIAKLKTRVATVFEASQENVHSSGAVVNDSRKGRD